MKKVINIYFYIYLLLLIILCIWGFPQDNEEVLFLNTNYYFTKNDIFTPYSNGRLAIVSSILNFFLPDGIFFKFIT